MSYKIILYDSDHLNLGCMHSFLESKRMEEIYDIISVSEVDEIYGLINDSESILILNSTGLPNTRVCNLLDDFREINSSLKIIIHSLDVAVNDIKTYYSKGIKCFLGYKTTCSELREALSAVIGGQVYLTEDTKTILLDDICNSSTTMTGETVVINELTPREKQILNLICEGLKSRDIARRLSISQHTVETHRRNIMLKLNISSSSQLVKFAMENNLIGY